MTLRPVFVGGCGRSGTTLLGAMLGSHPHALATPEAKFNAIAYMQALRERGRVDLAAAGVKIRNAWSFHVFGVAPDVDGFIRQRPDATYAELVLWIVEQYGQAVGKAQPSLWVDHTPSNILYAALLFELYPDAKLLHLVRDGRAVAASVMPLDWGPNTIDRAAQWWVHRMAHGFAAELRFSNDPGCNEPGCNERVMRIRYEDVVADPQGTMQQVARFLEIDYHKEMALGSGFQAPAFASTGHALVGSRPDPSRIDAWRSQLQGRQVEIFESIGGAVLDYLGYPLQFGHHARRLTDSERIKALAVDLYRQMNNRLDRRRRLTKVVKTTETVPPEVTRGEG